MFSYIPIFSILENWWIYNNFRSEYEEEISDITGATDVQLTSQEFSTPVWA
jgi:hypothetical protein